MCSFLRVSETAEVDSMVFLSSLLHVIACSTDESCYSTRMAPVLSDPLIRYHKWMCCLCLLLALMLEEASLVLYLSWPAESRSILQV